MKAEAATGRTPSIASGEVNHMKGTPKISPNV